jgi:hypothetical protein
VDQPRLPVELELPGWVELAGSGQKGDDDQH